MIKVWFVSLAAVCVSLVLISASLAENAESFHCVKMRESSLADLKTRMVSDCNLNKPFSMTSSETTLDSSYAFCCHKK